MMRRPTEIPATLVATLALAAPALSSDCSIDGASVTCTGTLSSATELGYPLFDTLIVTDLDADVDGFVLLSWFTPDSDGNGTPGVASANLSLSYDGGGYLLSPQLIGGRNFGAAAISSAGEGSSGDHDTVAIGTASSDPGGAGGQAGGAAVSFTGDAVYGTQATRNSEWLVFAQSIGGDGGMSDEAKVDTAGAAHGGVGGAGGDGGTASVAFVDGTLTVTAYNTEQGYPTSNYALLAQSNGGAGAAGGEAVSSAGNTHGGEGGSGGAGGHAVISAQGSGPVQVFAPGAAVQATSTGGSGGSGGDATSGTAGESEAGTGGDGGAGGPATVTIASGLGIEASTGAVGVGVLSQGGDGGEGGAALTGAGGNSHGGDGGDGAAGGTAALDLGAANVRVANTASAIVVRSVGGAGGDGGSGQTDVFATDSDGGDGGSGGDGGTITLTTSGHAAVVTGLDTQHGFDFASIAGSGGAGGAARAKTTGNSTGGNGGPGGAGGSVYADISADISTQGPQSQGIFARSYGGAGGDGGKADSLAGDGQGGAGAGSGPGGDVTLSYQGMLTTSGSEASGILAQSVGGFSGAGGDATGFDAFGAGSQSAGDGGTVSVTLAGNASIDTSAPWAYGVQAQSVGGGGGRGGSGEGLASLGGSGSAGGSGEGAAVKLEAGSSIKTEDTDSHAVHAMSVGGGGGDGGGADGIAALGGQGGTGGGGGAVTIDNSGTVATLSDRSIGLFGASIGGGGGSAHSTGGLVAFGGSGGSGGSGGAVAIQNAGTITSEGNGSDAVFAQSVGGGGGHGSSAISVSVGFSQAIGGTGGSGNAGGSVTYTDTGAAGRSIWTSGDVSRGFFLQSIGGGGGDGGNAIAASGPSPISMTLGSGGSGGAGGAGGTVKYVSGVADVATLGSHSTAIQVQSVGGGGGNAGTVVSGSSLSGLSLGFALGGHGSGGGAGGAVRVASTGALSTQGDHSAAVFAQSIGGGGGNASTSASGTAASAASLSATIGGKGGTGGGGGSAKASGGGGIGTKGDNAPGIHVQSVGGGGGHGGTTIDATGASEVSADVAIGGAGGAGGTGAGADVEWSDAIATGGHNAAGVIAQSIGGGGGSAGTTVAGSGYSQFSAQAAVGGAGGSGGGAAKVQATLSGMITTGGDVSPGLIAQSVGGGGGHSGTVVSGTALSSMAAAVSVGGSGGDGGDGGDLVAYAGAVATSGHSSAGIAATSVGGGGGSAHFTGAFSGVSSQSLDASVGGSGGAAGDGGSVNVGLGATITTKGHNAPGIKAMSIGGGGGDSGTTVSGSLSGAAAINVAVGGDGGTSGSGGAVSVSTASDTAAITTSGEHAEGIFAASVARSGGSAGHVVSGSAFSAGDVGLNLGGSGGRGGNAGAVQVTSTAAITTAGGYATGIEARSAGGGGGSAKGSITASALSMGNLAATIGGSGGSGGKAGTVTVTSGGAIATGDHHAHGILAQSLGGSGGNGGYAAQASFTGGEVSGEAAVSIGGGGGNGGTADAVSVTSTAAISTGDFRAAGILAQSVGGGGGSGGNVYTGNLSISTDGSATANVDIGGTGGAGAVAGTAMVSNAAGLATDGYLADGILAQSIGGNGGSGGSAYSVLATVQGANNANFGVDVGGKGGSGGDAAEVSVDNSGTISTGKGGSDAIAAMSVGGGGGKAGSAANINLNPLRAGAPTGNSLSATVTVGVGGSGGAAGDGAAVTLTNAGALSTEGDGSRAIHALSVGGGGGDGGTASSYSLSFNGVCSALSGGLGYGCKAKPTDPNTQTTNVKVNLTAEVGGSGGAAGDGDAVKVTNTGTIKTAGHLAHGVSAHSIGGGGGNGGEGAIGLQGWTTNKTANAIAGLPGNFTFIPSYSNISMTIGGTGGASGDGGAVTVGGAGSIETAGDHAYGVRAQSIGGGGGNGGAGAAGLWGVLTVGGRGSGGGDGGDVAVSQGPITTSGDGSIAIFAQSVGGGGGTAGDVEKGWTAAWADLNIGAGVAAQQSPGSGGDGGDVTVTAGPISTTGADATAIAAQSVGGSGGIAQVSGLVGGDGPMTFAGGAGDQGDAGLVTVTTNGAISVTGARGHGIFAQSTTGRTGSQDKSGGVAITINADLAATGADGRAILAQSEGGFVSLTGPIAITVAEGATVETGVGGAETIGIIDGNANTLANSGTIRNPGTAADDYVIRTNGIAPLAVENDGVIEGSVLSQMPASISTPDQAITVTNAEGAAFGLGATVDLGAGGSFANAGTISPGTVGTIGTSRFSGALTQAATGTLHVDYDVGGADDLLSVSAGVQPALAGTVDPEAQGTVPTSGTKGSFAFLTAASGLSSNGLTVADTATVDYALSQQAAPGGGQQVSLSYDIHYAPWLGSPIARAQARAADRAITPNHTRFARHVDDLVRFRAGATGRRGDDYPFVADLAFYLLEVPTVDDLLDVYDRFAPTGIFAPGDAALFGSLRFADGLNSCPAAGVDGVMVFVREGACAWLRTAGVATRRDSDGTSAAYDENVFSLSGGGQTELQPGWFGGFALGYETSEISGDGLDGDGYRIHAGAVLKRELGRTTLSASVSGGYGSTDLKRQVLTSAGLRRAAGSPDLTWIAGHLRAEHRVDMTPSSHLRPWIDLGIAHIMQDGYDETGAGDYGLAVDPIDTTYMTLNPVLDFGTRFEIGGMAAEATLSGGALIFLGDTDRSADVHLIGIGDAGPGFRVTDEGRQVYGDLGGSIKAQLNRRTSFEVALDTLLGEVEQQYRATAKLMIAF